MWYLLLFFHMWACAMDIELRDKTVRAQHKTVDLLIKYSPVVQATHDAQATTLQLSPLSHTEFSLLKHYLTYLEKQETNQATNNDKYNLIRNVKDAQSAALLAMAVDFLGMRRPPYEIGYTLERYLKRKKQWLAWKHTQQLKLPHLIPASVTASVCSNMHRNLATRVAEPESLQKFHVRIPPPYNSVIEAACLSPNATYCALAHQDSVTIYKGNCTTLPIVHHILGHAKVVTFLDNETLAIGSSRGYVWIHNLHNGQASSSVPACSHGTEIVVIRPTPDNYVLIGSQSGLSKVSKKGQTLWEQKAQNREQTFAFTTVDFCSKTNEFVTGESNGRALLWNGYSGLLIKELCTLTEPVVLVGFDQFNVPFVVGFEDNRVSCWNGKTNTFATNYLTVNEQDSVSCKPARGVIQKMWEKVVDKRQMALVNDSQGKQTVVTLQPDNHEYCVAFRVGSDMRVYDYEPAANTFLVARQDDDQITIWRVDAACYAYHASHLEVLSAAQLFFMHHVLREKDRFIINGASARELFFSLPENYQEHLRQHNKVDIPFMVRLEHKIPASVKLMYAKIKALLHQLLGNRVTFRV
jgi:hypothetical protein